MEYKKDRRALKGYVFDSFDHKQFDEVINLDKHADFWDTGEHEILGELIYKFNSDEHKKIGDLVKTFPATKHSKIRNVIEKYNSDEHQAIGDMLEHFSSRKHEKIQQLVLRFHENGHSLKASTMDKRKTLPSAEHKKFLGKPKERIQSKERNGTGKDYVDAIGGKPREDSGRKNLLTLPNGVRLTFSEIIALAGDYYGIPDKPIADPQYPDEVDAGAAERFKNAYSTLAVTPYEGEFKEQLHKLLKMMNDDSKKSKEAGQCQHSDKEWDEATGGAWFAGLPIIRGYMMKLAQNNFDHFLPNGKTAYLAGHKYAVQKAQEAGRSKDEERSVMLLSESRAIDAFACHFLTDAFASGHIRTPRVELAMNVTPRALGDLLCKYMHDEDNKCGIRVTNVRGDKWISYGDGMLTEECNKENFSLVVEAVQNSVNQLHEAYKNPDKTPDPKAITDLIPFVDKEAKNNTPLFEYKDGAIHRRADIHDLQDTNTVTNWWGSTTVLKLQRQKHRNPAIP